MDASETAPAIELPQEENDGGSQNASACHRVLYTPELLQHTLLHLDHHSYDARKKKPGHQALSRVARAFLTPTFESMYHTVSLTGRYRPPWGNEPSARAENIAVKTLLLAVRRLVVSSEGYYLAYLAWILPTILPVMPGCQGIRLRLNTHRVTSWHELSIDDALAPSLKLPLREVHQAHSLQDWGLDRLSPSDDERYLHSGKCVILRGFDPNDTQLESLMRLLCDKHKDLGELIIYINRGLRGSQISTISHLSSLTVLSFPSGSGFLEVTAVQLDFIGAALGAQLVTLNGIEITPQHLMQSILILTRRFRALKFLSFLVNNHHEDTDGLLDTTEVSEFFVLSVDGLDFCSITLCYPLRVGLDHWWPTLSFVRAVALLGGCDTEFELHVRVHGEDFTSLNKGVHHLKHLSKTSQADVKLIAENRWPDYIPDLELIDCDWHWHEKVQDYQEVERFDQALGMIEELEFDHRHRLVWVKGEQARAHLDDRANEERYRRETAAIRQKIFSDIAEAKSVLAQRGELSDYEWTRGRLLEDETSG